MIFTNSRQCYACLDVLCFTYILDDRNTSEICVALKQLDCRNQAHMLTFKYRSIQKYHFLDMHIMA